MKSNWFWKRSRPSTARFVEEAASVDDYSLFDLLHGYVYARWPYLYIGIGLGTHPVARLLRPVGSVLARMKLDRLVGRPGVGFADTYHGKVVPLDLARQLVTVREDVRLGDLEQIIPYARARDIVLENPGHIVALDCPCRMARENPCLPLDVCLVVGEPFASFVKEHHPGRTRWISQQEAVDILSAEQDRGHVSHAFFKDAMLNRFYAICNCCDCCCGAMTAHRNGTPMLASSGYVCRVDADLCIGCEGCVSFCQFHALSVLEGTSVVDEAACMGCGVCVAKCAQGALVLERDAAKGEPLEIQKLIAQAAGVAKS
jgi:Pyruvate/2-oxoacid:ferredoxin oxidoreductase delta subunit